MSSLAIVIPSLQAHAQLDALIDQIPEDLLEGVIVIDDGSKPAQRQNRVRVIRHPKNRGYGAAQKTGYAQAIEDGADRIVLLHGDGQYPVGPTIALAEELTEYDAALGSRFLVDGGAAIPRWRRWGNRFLSEIANRRLGCDLSELHTGARAFRSEALRALPIHEYSDNYLFDQQILVGLLRQGRSIGEAPVHAKYDDTVMSISPVESIRYGLGCLRVIAAGP
jgi:glycosyltransferase involved in cell wall biosynthesis